MLPGMDGVTLCRRLRDDPIVAHVPIIMLTARTGVHDRVEGLEAGADDYLTKPFYPQELLARVASHLRRSKRERYLNPLTHLPGRREIERAIQAKVRQKTSFAVCSVDIDTFKAYNDRYGFTAGDRAIQALAAILRAAVYTEDVPTDIVGHLGGDDFVFLIGLDRMVPVCEALVAGFDQLVPQLYTTEDYRRGAVRVLNRRNVWDEYPLMRLIVAAVPIRPDSPPAHTTTAWLSQTTAEIKSYLKTQPGSRYLIDRRTPRS
jgi:diguanylate cyclase (GGDEF)-like protein